MLIDCPRCGEYALSGSLSETLAGLRSADADASPKLSHALRRWREASKRPMLTTYLADAVVKHPLPRPREQADLLLRWLAENVPGPGETAQITYDTHGAIVGSKSPAGFRLVVDHLFESGLATGLQPRVFQGRDKANATLTFAGWDRYEDLKRGGRAYRKAFMAMKFGDGDLERVLDEVFRPSALRAGFQLTKLNDVPRAGLIDNRLRVEIQASDFVVADLTHDNLGAYWEAGYAEGLGKPVIYTCEKSKFAGAKTHFDTNHHLTILWDAAAPLECAQEFTATIRATVPHIALLEDATDASSDRPGG